jgi:hypothetical protein
MPERKTGGATDRMRTGPERQNLRLRMAPVRSSLSRTRGALRIPAADRRTTSTQSLDYQEGQRRRIYGQRSDSATAVKPA